MTILLGLLGLCVIVVIHEAGHFIAAKLTGICAESFSLGMGPILARKKIGETEFRLSLFPIGGYCGLKGENAFQQALDQNLPQMPREPRSFYESPIKRAIIAFAGPFANIVFAFLAFTVIAIVGYSYQTTDTRVLLATDIYPEMTSAAKKGGVQTGDIITSINGKEVTNFSDLYSLIATHPDETIDIGINRNGETLMLKVKTDMDKDSASGKIGVISWTDPIVTHVAPDSASAKAGIQNGDVIKSVDGVPVKNTAELTERIKNKTSVVLDVERSGKTVQLTLPIQSKTADDGSEYYDLGLGFPVVTVEVKAHSFFNAIAQGVKETANLIALTVKTITWFFKGIDVTKAVSGPIRITLMLGEATQTSFAAGFSEGLVTVLNFLSLISVSLFIMNLIPIPILDGGTVLFALIECVRGKGISPKFLYRFQFVGLVLIGFLFVFALTGDIRYIIERVGSLFAK